MAWTQTDIDALKAAIKTGHRRVTYGDKTVEYQTMAEMIRLLALMEADVAATNGTAGNGRTILVQHGRGV
ncbi:MAG: hypothetical protein WAP47_00730 [Candidatus Rokuibacteriota bacterium]